MANETYKRTLSGSVGAGLSSVFSGGGRDYYILEHKVSSKYHKAGEAQEIIVDQIELGRDAKCQVQFDESFKTVSRRHAAIVRDGNNWKLVQLSQTNSTFLNGHPIEKEWYLQNGDEIQLSVNGPKLGFIIPSGNKSKTGSIALSHRLSLFRQQALKPYRTAIAVMAAIIVVLLGGGITYGVIDHKHDIQQAEMSRQEIDALKQKAEQDLATMEAEARNREKAMTQKMNQMQRDFDKKLQSIQAPVASTVSTDDPRVTTTSTSNKAIAACEPNVYFVLIRKIVLTYEGKSRSFENIGSGTGFLLDDGRFVTARHVVEPWMFPLDASDEFNLMCNAVAHNGGTATCYLEAYSPTGKRFSFTSKQAIINRSLDERKNLDGMTIYLATSMAHDYAYFQTSARDGLSYHNALSNSLPVRAKLTILGYPLGIGANSETDIHPIYSEAVVAREGLERGCIVTTATTFEHGNSGGPVFATTNDGRLIVVGVVSAGAGRSTGLVVPISAIK